MLSQAVSESVLELPVEQRPKQARPRLIERVGSPAPLNDAMAEAIRRIEEVAAGRATGLTGEQFRAALQ